MKEISWCESHHWILQLQFLLSFPLHHATFANAVLTPAYLGVLEHIHEKWDMMTMEDCLPVHVALQLMDHSSLGRGDDYQDFLRTSNELQKALKAIVNGISPSDLS